MFTHNIMSDCEGALACQLLFQTLASKQSLNPFMEGLLKLTERRMKEEPLPIELKKHLLGIFLSSMYYNSSLTLQFLESQSLTSKLLDELVNLSDNFNAEYEKRFFNIGICNMLMSPELPASLGPHILSLLNCLVGQIKSLHDLVFKKIKAQSSREADIDADEDDEDSEYDLPDEGSESEEDESADRGEASESKNKNATEESKDPVMGTMNDDQLGFVEKTHGESSESDSPSVKEPIDDDEDNEDPEKYNMVSIYLFSNC